MLTLHKQLSITDAMAIAESHSSYRVEYETSANPSDHQKRFPIAHNMRAQQYWTLSILFYHNIVSICTTSSEGLKESNKYFRRKWQFYLCHSMNLMLLFPHLSQNTMDFFTLSLSTDMSSKLNVKKN